MTERYWQSTEDFVDNCHPDFIAGQLYFCDQSNKLEKAKEALKMISRVLIVEKSNKWSDKLSSDLSQRVDIKSTNIGNYASEKNKITSKIENLISDKKELKSRIDDEYKLLEYAKTLSNQ